MGYVVKADGNKENILVEINGVDKPMLTLSTKEAKSLYMSGERDKEKGEGTQGRIKALVGLTILLMNGETVRTKQI